jgi:hypothetical protein
VSASPGSIGRTKSLCPRIANVYCVMLLQHIVRTNNS